MTKTAANPDAWTPEGSAPEAYTIETMPSAIPYTDRTPLVLPPMGSPEETAGMQRPVKPLPWHQHGAPKPKLATDDAAPAAPKPGEEVDQHPGLLWVAPDLGLRVIRTKDFTRTAVWRVEKLVRVSPTASRWVLMFAAKARSGMEDGSRSCGFDDPRYLAFIASLPFKVA